MRPLPACPTPSHARLRTSGLALLVVLALAGCSDAGPSADPSAEATSSGTQGGTEGGSAVLQPGRPGEPATTVAPDDVTSSGDQEWNHDDVAFAQMMIPHHAQALVMSRLARTRAASDDVRRMAARIRAAQAPEIQVMAQWLAERNLNVPRAADDPSAYDHSEHGHQGMPGMLTEAQLRTLRDATGARFDRLFLTGMVAHHRGAVEMVDDVAVGGTDLRISEIATDIAAGQAAEIKRMRRMLSAL